ncbi:STAS domain-containing protein [Chlorobaculum thiosulfatiphilum]|uniref:STAS domain-containing protein n=1 Tax=Chlorobaculum thiosulfatiphilum TaxID=115852 RepID=A0A5C4S9J1_CHLTI|nr:STAS domain-containing protein [Chlorobaculum thiosulfatiphilum]TNJ40233.1 STAS domain-containing protein [Chlorobaculum thiosulfatiphilum]
MKHSVSTRKELTILKLEEPVFDVRHANSFKATIDSMVSNETSKNVIIDFSQVKAIDSSGIGSMLLAHQRANSSDGLAIFVSLCQQIKDLLKLTNLDKQLYIFSSINEVMTLIEPALKGKRSSRSRQPQVQDEGVDEIDVELEIPDEVFDSETFCDIEDETEENPELEELDELEESDEDEKPRQKNNPPEHPSAKKRGRPKKSPQNGKEQLKT